MSDQTFRRSRLAVAAALSFLAIAAGCGTNAETAAPTATQSPAPSAPSTPSTAGSIPEPPPPDRWITTTDPTTGVRFALPSQATPKTRPNNVGKTATLYQVDVGGGLGLGVSFSEADTAFYSAEGLDSLADSLVEQFKTAGANDATVTNRQPTTISNHPALDFQLSFTARTAQKSIWFVRVIGNQTRAIQLQSIAFVTPATEPSATPTIKKYHDILIASVHLP